MSAELAAPYGNGPASGAPAQVPAAQVPAPDSATRAQSRQKTRQAVARIRTHHLRQAKLNGERFAMLTAYDQYTAEISTKPASRCLLVGDSASNNVFAMKLPLPVTVDELIRCAGP